MREIAESLELAGTPAEVNVQTAEYTRLLGYPRGWELEGRARELAEWAREWYAAHGRPWFYLRQADELEVSGGVIRVDGAVFHSDSLRVRLEQADAHSAMLVAVGAGPEAEEEARRRWDDEKPDEYFFLETYASAVVEYLITWTGAKLCDWAEPRGMAVLPHSSPGYTEWEISEQPLLLELLRRTRGAALPAQVEVLDSGMLRPKKTQLAFFGLTRHTGRLGRLADLVPCENCSFGPCQYRRAPYRRAPRSTREPLPAPLSALDPDARYTVNRRALQRWAGERLTLCPRGDGCFDAVFRYDGTTCSNMGREMAFTYKVRLGPRAEGYPILEQCCAPAENDTGHTFMCSYIEDSASLMRAIDREKPLNGQKLEAVLAWPRESNAAGCYCKAASRDHKWGLVFETIHYALAQRELNGKADAQ